MIVKKLSDRNPIFPQNTTIQTLYFDIETTGLQKKNAYIYLIGCAHASEDGSFSICQWFAKNPDEEPEILAAFSDYAKNFSSVSHFNGDRFDLPFLAFRSQLYGIPCTVSQLESHDLYPALKPLRHLLALSGCRQQDFEQFLTLSRMAEPSGKNCIQIYRNLIKYRDLAYADPLLLHNLEDLKGLLACAHMKNYLQILEGDYLAENAALQEGALSITVRLLKPLLRDFIWAYQEFYLTAQRDHFTLQIQLSKNRLKNYYENYKDYYYLPREDEAIHKSIGSYVEKAHRRAATKETCYTWFLCTKEFCQDHGKLTAYLRHNLPILCSFPLT